MKINRISAYTLEKASSKPLLSFTDYSKFKYGDKLVALRFAENMTEALIKELGGDYVINNHSSLIVSTSPFWHTPPSAYALATQVHSLLNQLILEHSIGPMPFIKIDRSGAPSCDFSNLSLAEREQNMKKNSLSVDPALFSGKKLILVEDARITGAHEKKIIDHMEKIGLEELTFLYAIDVGQSGLQDPTIEHRMNHSVISNLSVLANLMRKPDGYYLNARACRFILCRSNRGSLHGFCRVVDPKTLHEIYTSSVNDGYATMDEYKQSFDILKQEIHFRLTHIAHKTELPFTVSAERLLQRMKEGLMTPRLSMNA